MRVLMLHAQSDYTQGLSRFKGRCEPCESWHWQLSRLLQYWHEGTLGFHLLSHAELAAALGARLRATKKRVVCIPGPNVHHERLCVKWRSSTIQRPTYLFP
ncbi:hypothetical protein WJX74_011043 [Apatococcus lobatus]|uniref:Uncharacterized protein n=1 Tax=Apatococcus lobatus TaxID=904363 RepID=A0AAW1S2A1_9CHLO